MDCICAIADSTNVRAIDLKNPRCPIHGTPVVNATDLATLVEIKGVINESMRQVSMNGRVIYVMDVSEVSSCARNLLSRYEIRRKR